MKPYPKTHSVRNSSKCGFSCCKLKGSAANDNLYLGLENGPNLFECHPFIPAFIKAWKKYGSPSAIINQYSIP